MRTRISNGYETVSFSASSARLCLSGRRRTGKFIIEINDNDVFLSPCQFETLVQLASARIATETGYLPVPPTQVDREYIRLQIHRLRTAIDDALGKGIGKILIETGVGTEYRLAVEPPNIVLEKTLSDLPTNILATSTIDALRNHQGDVQSD